MAWIWGLLGLVSSVCAFGVFFLIWKEARKSHTKFERLFLRIVFVCGLLMMFLAFEAARNCYIRAAGTPVTEMVTVDSVEVDRHYSTTLFIINTSSTSTEVALREYPNETFEASGRRKWEVGDSVEITFYELDGSRQAYDFR